MAQALHGQLSKVEIEALRRDLKSKGATFSIGENPATKRPLDRLCGLKIPPKGSTRFDQSPVQANSIASDLPESFNWCAKGACPPVRDQLNCGACWAFGTVAPLESNILIKNAQVTNLSEQWLVSCNTEGWDCDGGWWAHAYHINPGSVYESEFPYVAADVDCGGPYYHPYHIKSWHYVYTELSIAPTDMIKQALMEYGPVSSAIYTGFAFQSYTEGVFNISESGSAIVNHAVTIVGWDDNLGGGSWIIRNSWGTGWGENGYMYITYGTSKIGYSANYVIFESGVDFVSHLIDDDNEGGSEGNANGMIEPGETIELSLTLRNNTPTTVTSVTGSISLSDPYVTAVVEDFSLYGDIGSLMDKTSETPYILSIGEPVPQGHRININLSIQSDEGSWNTYLLLPIHSDPVITISPGIFYEEIPTSITLNKDLIIGNNGIWDLDFILGAVPTFGMLPEDYPSSGGSTLGFGGPDNSGHVWIDSDEPDGPTYEWIEIKTQGTSVLLGDDDAEYVTLPFTFPFYGSGKNSLLISSNGYITFGEIGDSYSNHPIPYNQTPNDIIVPRWCDFNPDNGNQGIVYYYHDEPNNRFIIEWDHIEHYPSGDPETFQVILKPDGTIYFQYKTVATEEIGTVGIENAGGDDGIQITISNSYLHNEKAIYISPGSDWLSFGSSTGKVSPGETNTIALTFKAPNDGSEGIHTSRILIKSNDPRGMVILPVILDVWGDGPQIMHTPYEDTYDEDGPYIIEAVIRSRAGLNIQGPSLYWKLDGSPDFHEIPMEKKLNDTFLSLIPGQPAGSVIDYYIYARDMENTVKTNPKDAPTQIHRFSIIPRAGLIILGSSPIENIMPPDSKGMISPAFQIQNSGNDDLEYSIQVEYTPYSTRELTKPISPTKPLSFSPGEVITSWKVPSQVEWPWGIGCDGTKVWVGGTGSEISPPYSCEDWEFNSDGAATGRHFSCNGWRDAWTADMTWDGKYLWQINVGGDNGIYQIDPDNGSVIDTITDPEGIWSGISQRGLAYCSEDDSFYIGGWEAERVYHIQGLSHPEPGSIISSFSFPDVSGLEWHPAGTLWIATHNIQDMIYQVAPDDGTVLSQFPHPAHGSYYGGGLAIDKNGDLWITKQGEQIIYLVESGVETFDWLNADPLSGMVGIMEDQPISLYFDTKNLTEGTYTADISISSNDPEKTTVKIPVYLHVDSAVSLPEWNIMLYLDGDNNLEPYAIQDFMEASSVLLTTDTRVLIEMDRIGGYSIEYGNWSICHRFVLEPGMTPVESNAVLDWGDGQGGREVNMADPATLSQFVNWGITNYPAKHFAVILWNHGEGWRNLEKQALKAVCYDETSKDYLYTSEIGTAFQNAGMNPDIIGIDACLLGMIEVAYEIRNEGDIFIASEANIPVDGWPYDTIFEDMVTTPGMNPNELAKAIVSRYGESYNMDRTLSATKLNQMDTVAAAVTDLAASLMDINNQWHCVAEARNISSYYDTWGEYRDLSGFAQALISCTSDESIRQKAQNLKDALDAAIIALHFPTHLPSYGLSTYFVNPTKSTSIDANYNCSKIQYACDTAWDEFLQAFLTVDVTPPLIQHIPLSNTLDTVGPYHLQANIQDISGVKDATVYWRKNNGNLHTQKMIFNGSYYVGDMPGPSQVGDHYSYRIDAVDNPGNRGYYPGPGSDYFQSFDIGDAFEGLWEEFTWLDTFDLSHKRIKFVPDPLDAHLYDVCIEDSAGWSVDSNLGVEISLGDDTFAPCELTRGALSYYGNIYDKIFIGSNGYITLIDGDTDYDATLSNHFRLPRLSPAFIDLNPMDSGTVRFYEMPDRAVVTFIEIKEYDTPGTNSFQVELFYTGLIRFTYLDMSLTECIVGLSNGQGIPQGEQSDFSSLPGCITGNPPSVTVVTPEDGQKGNIYVEYALYDASSLSSSIHIQFSLDNGASWQAVTDGMGGEGRMGLTGAPEGINHIYSWNAMADLEQENYSTVKLQITPFHIKGVGLPQETDQFLVYNPSIGQVTGYLLGLQEAPGGDENRLDVNQDGMVDIADLVTLNNNQ
jgi:hypothetical protein